MTKKESLFKMLHTAFIVIRAEYAKYPILFAISDFLHNLPLKLLSCASEKEQELLFKEYQKKILEFTLKSFFRLPVNNLEKDKKAYLFDLLLIGFDIIRREALKNKEEKLLKLSDFFLILLLNLKKCNSEEEYNTLYDISKERSIAENLKWP